MSSMAKIVIYILIDPYHHTKHYTIQGLILSCENIVTN